MIATLLASEDECVDDLQIYVMQACFNETNFNFFDLCDG